MSTTVSVSMSMSSAVPVISEPTRSAATVTTLWSTEQKPPATTIGAAAPSCPTMRTVPRPRRARIGWRPGSTPNSPSIRGTETRSASPAETVPP